MTPWRVIGSIINEHVRTCTNQTRVPSDLHIGCTKASPSCGLVFIASASADGGPRCVREIGNEQTRRPCGGVAPGRCGGPAPGRTSPDHAWGADLGQRSGCGPCAVRPRRARGPQTPGTGRAGLTVGAVTSTEPRPATTSGNPPETHDDNDLARAMPTVHRLERRNNPAASRRVAS